ncbi:hypothetical protein L1887_20183 [Cichorium endivia]|nr:hypothetical protein L1887_20183 [Cichorium endivia]
MANEVARKQKNSDLTSVLTRSVKRDGDECDDRRSSGAPARGESVLDLSIGFVDCFNPFILSSSSSTSGSAFIWFYGIFMERGKILDSNLNQQPGFEDMGLRLKIM